MTEIYDFDAIHPRRSTQSIKWNMYDEDVLPLWVADTDFTVPKPVIDALTERVQHGIFGYQMKMPSLDTAIIAWLERLYGWQVAAEEIVYIPTLVAALNITAKVYGQAGSGVLIQPPIYPPFLSAPANFGQTLVNAPLTLTRSGQRLRYEIDFDAFEAAITPETRLFLFCNPHNPVGRMYTRAELERIAEICLRHDITIISDEIHSDLVMEPGMRHIPMATLSPEVAAKTITLMAPSKTFNLAGLQNGYAIVKDKTLRDALSKEVWSGTIPFVNVLGWTAAEAAYAHGQSYVEQLLPYLRANRDALVEYVETCLPDVGVTVPEGTYLAWLDMRNTAIADDPFTHLRDKGRIAPNDGKAFGIGGEGFVRLNFATPRSVLMDGLDRVRKTLEG